LINKYYITTSYASYFCAVLDSIVFLVFLFISYFFFEGFSYVVRLIASELNRAYFCKQLQAELYSPNRSAVGLPRSAWPYYFIAGKRIIRFEFTQVVCIIIHIGTAHLPIIITLYYNIRSDDVSICIRVYTVRVSLTLRTINIIYYYNVLVTRRL